MNGNYRCVKILSLLEDVARFYRLAQVVKGNLFSGQVKSHLASWWLLVLIVLDQAHTNVPYKLTSLLLLGQGSTSNMVPFWDQSGNINALTSKKIPLTAL